MHLKKFLSYFIIGSLIFHLILVIGIAWLLTIYSAPAAENPIKEQEVIWLNPQNPPLLDLPKPKNEQKPKQAHAIASHNVSVKEETVAKKNPQATLTDKSADTIKKPENQAKDKSQNLKLDAPVAKLNSKSTLYTPPVNGESLTKSSWDRFNHDFMPSIRTGEKTWVNAASVPEAQYFSMLKRIFRLRFNPAPVLRSYFSSHHYDAAQVRTGIIVILDASGRLKRVSIAGPSGIKSYDAEVAGTVEESAPFAAPPARLLYQNELSMRWFFITYLR